MSESNLHSSKHSLSQSKGDPAIANWLKLIHPILIHRILGPSLKHLGKPNL